MTYSKAQEKEARAHLKKVLRKDDKLYAVIKSVSRSGMTRRMEFYYIRKNKPRLITPWIARACGYSDDCYKGMLVKGCGMDMIFAVVYDVSAVLYGDGNKLKHGQL